MANADGAAINDLALQLLLANRRSGYSANHGLDYAYTCPSPGRYPFQWFWDSCFHAIVLARLDPDWARRELRTLVSVQRADGFLPHAIFWEENGFSHYWKYLQSRPSLRPRTSAYIQPPTLAFAVLRVYEATGDEAFAREMLPRVGRYHDWLRRKRDPDADNLISIASPFESGMDWSPQFDPLFGLGSADHKLRSWVQSRLLDLRHFLAGHDPVEMLRRFDVEELATNCIWYEAQDSLRRLAESLGDERLAATEARGAAQTQQSILEQCWDEETHAFYSVDRPTGARLKVRSAASLLPLLLDGLPSSHVEAIVRDIENPLRFGTPVAPPSVAVDEPFFTRKPVQLFWRGPTWLNMTWFVVRGLIKHGHAERADSLARAAVAAVLQSGFRESYEPYNGVGLGARNFGWSTLAAELSLLVAQET